MRFRKVLLFKQVAQWDQNKCKRVQPLFSNNSKNVTTFAEGQNDIFINTFNLK